MQKISALIPTYYRYPDLYNLVTALLGQTIVPDEILVVDQTPIVDRPTNYDEWILENNVTLINQPTPSQPLSRNLAALKAKHDLLLLLDDDIEIGDDYVESHLSVMSREGVDAVSGGTTTKDELPVDYPWKAEVLDPIRYISAAPNYVYEGMMMGISSGNCLIKRSVFLSVGGFDDECPRMVDFELGYRLFRSGAKLFYSSLPFAKHLRSEGGTRHRVQKDYRLMAPIYIHMKHYPGWIYQQYILRHIRLHVLKKRFILSPWNIFKQLFVLKDMQRDSKQRLAHYESIRIDNRLKKIRNMGIGCNCHPMMTELEIYMVKEVIRQFGSGVRVLEYGSGFSTIFFPQYLEALRYNYGWYSVEHNTEWYKKIQATVSNYQLTGVKIKLVDFQGSDPRITKLQPELREQYIMNPFKNGGSYDVVIIDGRYRKRVYKYVMDTVDDKTVVIVFDSERVHYQEKHSKNYHLLDTGLAVCYPVEPYTQKQKSIQVTCKDTALWNKTVAILREIRMLI